MFKKMLTGMLFVILMLGFTGISNATEYQYRIIDIKQFMPEDSLWHVGGINNNNIVSGYYYYYEGSIRYYYLWWYNLDTDVFDSEFSGNIPECAGSALNNLNVFLSYNRLFNIDTKIWSIPPVLSAKGHNDNGAYLYDNRIWDNGIIINIDLPSEVYFSRTGGLNNSNYVSGYVQYDYQDRRKGFIYNTITGEYLEINNIGEHLSFTDINNNNIAVGYYPGQTGTLATVDGYSERLVVEVGNSFATAGINDNNVVVGGTAVGYGPVVAVGIPIHNVSIAANITVTENETVFLTVSLNAITYETLTIDFETVNGSALAGVDYVPISGTLVFSPGEQHKTIEISLIDDIKYELTKDFTVVLSNQSEPFTIINDIAIVTILDNDEQVFYSVVVSSPGVGNGGYTDFDGTSSIEEDSVITINAIADINHEFTGWIGASAGQENNNPLIIIVKSNMTITATFGESAIDVIVDIDPFFLYLDKKTQDDKLTIQSKKAVNFSSLSDGEILPVELMIIFKGKGVNGGDIVLQGMFDVTVKDGDVIILKK